MEEARYIPESEFAEDFSRKLSAMARAVAFSGLTISEIAETARVDWRTVYAVSQSRPVRMESACRVMYALKDRESNQQQPK